MTPTDDPSHDEDLSAFDFAEAVNVVGRALWTIAHRKVVKPVRRWDQFSGARGGRMAEFYTPRLYGKPTGGFNFLSKCLRRAASQTA